MLIIYTTNDLICRTMHNIQQMHQKVLVLKMRQNSSYTEQSKPLNFMFTAPFLSKFLCFACNSPHKRHKNLKPTCCPFNLNISHLITGGTLKIVHANKWAQPEALTQSEVWMSKIFLYQKMQSIFSIYYYLYYLFIISMQGMENSFS